MTDNNHPSINYYIPTIKKQFAVFSTCRHICAWHNNFPKYSRSPGGMYMCCRCGTRQLRVDYPCKLHGGR